jgi:hypothetical protein
MPTPSAPPAGTLLMPQASLQQQKPLNLAAHMPLFVVFIATTDEQTGDTTFALLPNARLVGDQRREGAVPASARYAYDFGVPQLFGATGTPNAWDEVLPLAAKGPYTVAVDDRVVAFKLGPKGSLTPVADGFLRAVQADASAGGEQATFECAAVPIRCWDRPIYGLLMRDGPDLAAVPAQAPAPEDDQDLFVQLPVRFNPDGRPNCTPKDADHSVDPGDPSADAYPVFVDPLIERDPDQRRHWTLGGAVRYIMGYYNGDAYDYLGPNAIYAHNYELDAIEGLLQQVVPAGAGEIDPDDPDTFKQEPILCPDVDVTGLSWPEAVERLIEPFGFALRFDMLDAGGGTLDAPGLPVHNAVLYRRNAPGPRKVLYQQAAIRPGPTQYLDLDRTNVPDLALARDDSVENAWLAVGALAQYELSVVLAPLFEPDPADAATDAAKAKFRENNPKEFWQGENSIKYREFGAAEAGDGYYDYILEAWSDVGDVLDLAGVLDGFGGKPPRVTVRRRRPALRELVSKDPEGTPRRPELYISTDYDPEGEWPTSQEPRLPPCIWNRDEDRATWQKVEHGWELLPDRLGIRITVDDPDTWNIGKAPPQPAPPAAPVPYPYTAGKVNAITAMATPDPAAGSQRKIFYLRLVCAVEADVACAGLASRREVSPSRFGVTRLDEARERFLNQFRHPSSPYAPAQAQAAEAVRDDAATAETHAAGKRAAHEAAKFAGSATIPWISFAYEIGDKIWRIQGRDVPLNGLLAGGGTEPDVVPTVVAIDRTYDGRVATVLQLEDRRAEPVESPRYTRAATRKEARYAASIGMGGGAGGAE